MVVDSSVWLEIYYKTPLSSKCEKALSKAEILVPSLVLFEVYKKLKTKVDESVALEVVGGLSQNRVLDFTREVALLAADLSIEHKLGMADSIVLAHSRYEDVMLVTMDSDFGGLENVRVIRG